MEETVANVHLEENELHHRDFSRNQSTCKNIKNLAVAAEEIFENPEYVVVHRSIAVQTITNEEVVIPKQDPAHNQRHNLIVASSESGNTMEMEISSQESVMDIASQESLSFQDSNSKEPHSNHKASISFRENALLAREKNIQEREEAILEYEAKVKKREEDIANREIVMAKMEMDIEERQEILHIKEQQIAERETAVKIRELEADGYRVVTVGNESNDNICLPAKRPKRN